MDQPEGVPTLSLDLAFRMTVTPSCVHEGGRKRCGAREQGRARPTRICRGSLVPRGGATLLSQTLRPVGPFLHPR